MDTVLQLSRGFFTLDEMEQMECEVLQRLRWHVHPPTAQLFLKHFLFFLPAEDHELQDLHDLCQFMIELSVMEYFFVSYKPSEVAIAALHNAMDHLGYEKAHLSSPFVSQFFDIDSPAVLACRAHLSLILATAIEQSAEDDPESPVGVSESPQLQRTLSPMSVMAHPEPNETYSPSQQTSCRQLRFETSPTNDDVDADDNFVADAGIDYH